MFCLAESFLGRVWLHASHQSISTRRWNVGVGVDGGDSSNDNGADDVGFWGIEADLPGVLGSE